MVTAFISTSNCLFSRFNSLIVHVFRILYLFDVPSETPVPCVLTFIAWVLHILCACSKLHACSHVPLRYLENSRGGNQPIVLFLLSKCHPPSPNAPRNPGLVDVVHRISGRSRIAPRSWVTTVGRRGWNQTEWTGG